MDSGIDRQLIGDAGGIKTLLLFLAVASLGVLSSLAEASVLLDIPPRKQWENRNGYCGACSIQQVALYHGAYVSQAVSRAIIDPDQDEEVLVGVNMAEVLNSLSFEFECWQYDAQPTPQYRDYLVWIAQHLEDRHPVIITCYIKGMGDPDYDHIMVAVGFTGADPNSYQSNDEISYNDCFSPSPFTRTYGSFYDDRSMQENGALYEYCIPKQVDYGCAVTGIKDVNQETYPVRLSVDDWEEPNITLGEAPKTLNATIQVDGLSVGRSYLLLRYDDYRNVPSGNFRESSFDSSREFVPETGTYYLSDQFMSDEVVIYRCIANDETHYVDLAGVCGGKTPCYTSIQQAVDAADNGATIKIVQGTYNEELNVSLPNYLTLSAGWDITFTTQSGTSTVNSMAINNGSVTVDSMVIE